MASVSRPTYKLMTLSAVQHSSQYGRPVSRQKIKAYLAEAYSAPVQPSLLRAAIRRCEAEGELVVSEAKSHSFKLTAAGKAVLAGTRTRKPATTTRKTKSNKGKKKKA